MAGLRVSRGPGSTSWRSITYPFSLSYQAQAGPKSKENFLASHHSTVESWEVPAFVLGSMPIPQAPLWRNCSPIHSSCPQGQASDQSTFHWDHWWQEVPVQKTSESFRLLGLLLPAYLDFCHPSQISRGYPTFPVCLPTDSLAWHLLPVFPPLFFPSEAPLCPLFPAISVPPTSPHSAPDSSFLPQTSSSPSPQT